MLLCPRNFKEELSGQGALAHNQAEFTQARFQMMHSLWDSVRLSSWCSNLWAHFSVIFRSPIFLGLSHSFSKRALSRHIAACTEHSSPFPLTLSQSRRMSSGVQHVEPLIASVKHVMCEVLYTTTVSLPMLQLHIYRMKYHGTLGHTSVVACICQVQKQHANGGLEPLLSTKENTYTILAHVVHTLL